MKQERFINVLNNDTLVVFPNQLEQEVLKTRKPKYKFLEFGLNQ